VLRKLRGLMAVFSRFAVHGMLAGLLV